MLVFGALFYQSRSLLNVRALSLENAFNFNKLFIKFPCDDPIPYALGTFDPKFNISKDYFLSALSEAEALWEKAIGKNLFIYTPFNFESDVVKINLVYDYRQQATDKLKSLGLFVNNDKASYDMLGTRFVALNKEFTAVRDDYNARAQNFNDRQKAFEDQVAYWNSQGGAPPEEYDKLQAEKLALNALLPELQALRKQINDMSDEINALVTAINRLVGSLNLSVKKYNTVNASRGESFEEGLYIEDGTNKKIDIYEFSSREKLVLVLAHELGHALGFPHVDDPKAIMYKLNQSEAPVLTEADLSALKAKCGIK